MTVIAYLVFSFRKSKSHSIKTDDSPKGGTLLPWKRVTALLGVMKVLSERMWAESHTMAPPLFLFLSWSFEEREISKEDTLDYTQQLVLSNLHVHVSMGMRLSL